jgi:hypothetical protein
MIRVVSELTDFLAGVVENLPPHLRGRGDGEVDHNIPIGGRRRDARDGHIPEEDNRELCVRVFISKVSRELFSHLTDLVNRNMQAIFKRPMYPQEFIEGTCRIWWRRDVRGPLDELMDGYPVEYLRGE